MANFVIGKNWKFWYYTLQLWQILWNNFVNWILWKSEREPDGRGKNSQRALQEAENRQQKRFWQCVYAALSLTCVSVFIAILLFLFFIFHNLDNKPWTSIFPNLFYENNWRKEEKTLQYFDLSDDIFLMNHNEVFEFWNKFNSAEKWKGARWAWQEFTKGVARSWEQITKKVLAMCLRCDT